MLSLLSIMKKTSLINNPTTNEKLYVIESKEKGIKINQLVDNNHNSFFTIDRNNTIWGLTWHFGVYRFGRVNEEGQLVNAKELSTTHTVITPVVEYNALKHEIIIAVDALFFIYDIETESISRFNLEKEIGGNVRKFDAIMATDGNYWLGTTKGLAQCSFRDGRKSKMKLWNDKNGLLNNSVSSVHQDATNNNTLWIATKGGGLHKMDLKTKDIQYYNTENILPNNVIYGILEDDNNTLWMSSNKGIISFNKKTEEVRKFYKS